MFSEQYVHFTCCHPHMRSFSHMLPRINTGLAVGLRGELLFERLLLRSGDLFPLPKHLYACL